MKQKGRWFYQPILENDKFQVYRWDANEGDVTEMKIPPLPTTIHFSVLGTYDDYGNTLDGEFLDNWCPGEDMTKSPRYNWAYNTFDQLVLKATSEAYGFCISPKQDNAVSGDVEILAAGSTFTCTHDNVFVCAGKIEVDGSQFSKRSLLSAKDKTITALEDCTIVYFNVT